MDRETKGAAPAHAQRDPSATMVKRIAFEALFGDGDSAVIAGRYEIRRQIGRGAMGVVYEAFDRERNATVALKMLTRIDPEHIYGLKNEFRALSEVLHPNLVRLHELFVDDHLWLFSMELVQGEPFDRWVRPTGRLDVERLGSALPQLVNGVRAIHDAGKLHRDLKPGNVLVTREGRVVILDFGLAGDPEVGGVGQTVDPWAAGTPAYMAPEQAAGEPTSAASDWYALGAMLFEVLAGRLPFQGSSKAMLDQKQAEPAPSVDRFVTDAPPELCQLCSALLERDAAERPDAAALAARFELRPSRMPPRRGRPGTSWRRELVGREPELAALRAASAAAEADTPTLVVVGGESGVGKSALVDAFLEELTQSSRAVILRGRCFERESLPYNALDQLIDDLSRHLRRLPQAEALAMMPRNVRALSRIFPALARLEAVHAVPQRPFPGEHALRLRAFGALGELFGRVRDRGPLVVHVDDLQWADDDSAFAFELLLSDPELSPLLLIASHRPQTGRSQAVARIAAAARANRRLALHEVSLGPLSRQAARELAGKKLDASAAPELIDTVVEEAKGNPFLLQELARHAAIGGKGRVSLAQVLEARVAPLGEDARRLLQLAAFSSGPTTAEVLVAASEGAADPHRDLDALRDAQLLCIDSDRRYECYHDRVRVAVIDGAGEAERPALHRSLAAAWAERGDADPELLFEHFGRAGMRQEASARALEAADRAVRNLAFERAAELRGRALELMDPKDPSRARLFERRAEALSLAGRWGEAAEAFEEAEHATDDDAYRNYLMHQAAHHYLGSGRQQRGMPLLRRVFDVLGMTWPRTRIGAIVSALVKLVCYRLGGARYQLVNEDVPAHFDALGRSEAVGHDLYALGSTPPMAQADALLSAAGLVTPYDSVHGLYLMTAFVQRALRIGEPTRVATALGILAVLFSRSPSTRRLGSRFGDEAIVLARRSNATHLRSGALGYVAYARLLEGKLQLACEAGGEALATLQSSGRAHAMERWMARSVQALSLMLLGRAGEAAELFRLTSQEARELGDDLATVCAESVLASLVEDDIVGARELLERKSEAMDRVGVAVSSRGIMLMERISCALYVGDAAEASKLLGETQAVGMLFFDLAAITANCALLAYAHDGSRRNLRLVARSVRRLRRVSDPPGQALAQQLDGALRLAAGDRQGAIAALSIAMERYHDAGMRLHETTLAHRRGALIGGDEGAQERAAAEREIRARGVVNPARWVAMLAPGLDPELERGNRPSAPAVAASSTG